MNNIEVVLTPALLPLYDVKGKIVVVIDILRATSSICVAFDNGVKRIKPVMTPEESKSYKKEGFLCAAERNGEVVKGFDIGNSPFSYMGENMNNASIALTTTNGTRAIELSKEADAVVIGSFLNLDYLCSWIKDQNKDVLLLCAGWKDKVNLEDTLFAGAMIHNLRYLLNPCCDSSIAAEDLYNLAKTDLYKYILKSSHAHRFKDLGIEEDIAYCMKQNTINIIPILEGDFLVKLNR